MYVCIREKLETNAAIWEYREREKNQGLKRRILFLELFTNIKRFGL